ncbi:MAG: ABC transporter ATP-binding protein [Metamycoplasmataceae bacterium]
MQEIAIEFINLTKKFGNFTANENISLIIKKGEIHSLVGENGAGKSTLMSILFGLYQPTFGLIRILGNEVNIKNAHHANRMGISMVHQHFKLVKNFTNLENIILGLEPSKRMVIDNDYAINKVLSLQKKYNLHFDLFNKTSDEPVVIQQKIEIMKMLFNDADILIFDEPSAVLTPEEIKNLLKSIKNLKEDGKTIIFISHKLDEVLEISDNISVLRQGKLIKTIPNKEVSTKDITNAMVGTEISEIKNNLDINLENRETIFSFQNISGEKIKNISFNIKQGEIFAIAGVSGNGQEEIEYIASGLKKQKEGKIYFKSKPLIPSFFKKIITKKNVLNNNKIQNDSFLLEEITKKNVNQRIKAGISYIPGDRHKYGLALDMDMNENYVLRIIENKAFQKHKLIKNKEISLFSSFINEKYDVRGVNNGYAISRSLSGGNQQKAVVGRELETDHNFVIIVQPTRGLDVGAINNIHNYILKEKELGKAILLISFELDEVLALADTIAVINQGKIVETKNAKELTREEIGLLMAGIKKEVENVFN